MFKRTPCRCRIIYAVLMVFWNAIYANYNRLGIRRSCAKSSCKSFLAFVFSVMRGPFVEEFHQCVTYAFYTAQWQEQLYTSLSLVLMFVLPLVVLIATYVATFLTIAGQKNAFRHAQHRSAIDSARQKVIRKAKVKSLMITVVIVLAFVVCWTPYYVTMIIFVFLDPGERLSQGLREAVFFFGSSTAAINPLIYGAFHLGPGKRMRRIRKSVTTFSTLGISRTSLGRLHRASEKESFGLRTMIHDGDNSLYRHRRCRVSNVVGPRCNGVVQRQNSVTY